MFEAVNNFILAFIPGVVQDRLFRGYQNRAALPHVQDFTVFTLSQTRRIGTNALSHGENSVTFKVLREYTYDIDFCAINQETAQRRAAVAETLGRSYVAADFFAAYEASVNFSNDILYIPYTDLTEEYIHRYRVSLRVTHWESVDVEQEYAENVKIRVENIDAHHKVKGVD